MSQYYYLIATLPMLEFGMKAPFSYEELLARCKEQISDRDLEILKRGLNSSTSREWKDFDTDLRNEIARARANKKAKDPDKYIRGENYLNPFMAGIAHWAVSQESPKDAELYLDRIRWEKIEELKKSHYFNIDFLIVYALQLQILERWDNINKDGGIQILEEIIA